MASLDIAYEPPAGEHIAHACRESLAIANRRGAPVVFRFNGVDVTAAPGETPEAVHDRWQVKVAEQSEAYRSSSEGRRAKAEAAERLRSCRRRTDALMARLPGVVGDLAALVRWCVELSDAADHVGVKWNPETAVAAIEAAGYRPNAHVGRPSEDFADRRIMGEYLVGQALDGMRKGMPPRQIIDSFAREAGFIR
jgi:hypothetical protein